MKHDVYMHATKDAATLSSLDIQSQSFLSEKVQAKKGKKNGVLKGGILMEITPVIKLPYLDILVQKSNKSLIPKWPRGKKERKSVYLSDSHSY